MSLNLPRYLAPLRWADYFGHKPLIHNLLRRIEDNSKLTPNSFYVSGETGTGKTALVNLLIRSYKCENPQPYTLDGRTYQGVDPCGQCPTCRTHIDFRDAVGSHTNIKLIQYNRGDGETADAQVKEAVQLARVPPIMTAGARKAYRFLVFDEWQRFSKPLRQDVLLHAEASPPTTIFFFITMSEEELGERSRTALASRGLELNLRGLTQQEITEFLLTHVNAGVPKGFPLLREPEARAIAARSHCSLRQAIAHYGLVAGYDLGTEFVRPTTIRYFLQYASPADRLALWQAVGTGAWRDVDQTLEALGRIYDPANMRQLGLDLITDVQRAMRARQGTLTDQLWAIDHLFRFVGHARQLNLGDYLAMFAHLDLGVVQTIAQQKEGDGNNHDDDKDQKQ